MAPVTLKKKCTKQEIWKWRWFDWYEQQQLRIEKDHMEGPLWCFALPLVWRKRALIAHGEPKIAILFINRYFFL